MSDDDPKMKTAAAPDRVGQLLLAAWLVATVASLGSLFFSEVMELPPCSLCWYQRCFMFPLAIVLLIALVRADRGVARYALPLAAGGFLVALYHFLLYVGVIPEAAAPCQAGISCTEGQFVILGIFSIPLLSLGAFAVIALLLLAAIRSARHG